MRPWFIHLNNGSRGDVHVLTLAAMFSSKQTFCSISKESIMDTVYVNYFKFAPVVKEGLAFTVLFFNSGNDLP